MRSRRLQPPWQKSEIIKPPSSLEVETIGVVTPVLVRHIMSDWSES